MHRGDHGDAADRSVTRYRCDVRGGRLGYRTVGQSVRGDGRGACRPIDNRHVPVRPQAAVVCHLGVLRRQQRAGCRRAGVRRCCGRTHCRRDHPCPVLLAGDRILAEVGVGSACRSRTCAGGQWGIGRTGHRRAAVDVAWRRGGMAHVVCGVGRAVGPDVVLVAALLPRVDHESMSARSRSGGQRQLAAVATSNTLVFLGQFTVYTFIAVLLLSSGVGPAFVGPILLACGASGLLGLWYAGRGLDRNPRRTALLLVALILAAVVMLGASWPALVTVLVATAIWSGAFGGVPSIYQACAVRARAMPPELAGAWINSTANIGIAGGAAIGAGVLHVAGPSVLPWPGAALIACGLGVMALSRRAFPREP